MISILSCTQKPTGEIFNFNENWEFYCDSSQSWLKANVPGNIHTDLLNNNLIPNPFYCANEYKLQWIGEKEWHYRKIFAIQKLDEKQERNYEIVFDGLDTHAEVFLNSVKIGQADNMFLQWVFPIPDSLLKYENILEVIFRPASDFNNSMKEKNAYSIPDKRIYSRKAQYHSGWDWAPRYETIGIYKNVYLRYWEKLRIVNVKLEQDIISDTAAYLTAYIDLESENYYNGDIRISSPDNLFDTVIQSIEIFEGRNIYPISFRIPNPRLWWCNGLGEAFLYNFDFRINTKFRHETKRIRSGLRQIELITELDTDGQAFYFIINGLPVFARGANWVPAEFFNGNNSYKNYLELLTKAKDANFNMIRVWGGGIYENDDFYLICDSLGIMVWQDFMFACAMYPDDEQFISNVEKEIEYQVKRLHNHPSIVLWCGNNEISNAWFDWGWQKQFELTHDDSEKIWKSYDNLFHRIIPEIISKNDKSRIYIPSTPFYGWGRPESRTHGTSHYWGVWWGMKDFNEYNRNTGRFMGEYGFQSFPELKSMKNFIPTDSMFLYSESIKAHQKHPFGFEAIKQYMKKYYKIPIQAENYFYISQLLQAEALQTAVDAHLSAMPYCMGSLFWQYNDCWPVISWSVIDYYKQAKAAYYVAKKSFDKNHIAIIKQNRGFEVFLVNHHYKTINSQIEMQIISFQGDTIYHQTKNIVLPILSSVKTDNLNIPDSIAKLSLNDIFIQFTLKEKSSQEIIAERSFTPGNPTKLRLPEAEFNVIVNKSNDLWEIKLKSSNFVKSLYINCINVSGSYSDNYFDLLPNREETIIFTTDNTKTSPDFRFKSLNDLIERKVEKDEISEYIDNERN